MAGICPARVNGREYGRQISDALLATSEFLAMAPYLATILVVAGAMHSIQASGRGRQAIRE
jgi:ABC-type uncharacterized transport system permease subunit